MYLKDVMYNDVVKLVAMTDLLRHALRMRLLRERGEAIGNDTGRKV